MVEIFKAITKIFQENTHQKKNQQIVVKKSANEKRGFGSQIHDNNWKKIQLKIWEIKVVKMLIKWKKRQVSRNQEKNKIGLMP